MTNVEKRQWGTGEKFKVPYPDIIREYNFHINVKNIHDQLKTTYELDRKSKFQYYLRIFFDLMDSIVIINGHIITKTN